LWHGGDVRVLVVDDDRRLVEALRRGLVAEDFAVDVAFDGDEALWRVREADYDALVLDVMMPGPDGLTVTAQLRAAGVWAPILVLTARGQAEDEVRALDIGADDFLAKPFSFGVLLARLRALLRRGRTERPVRLTAGDLELDPATHVVARGGTPVELTPRQFALLELFLRRAGEALSRQQILAHVWDFAYDGDPNIVEVYVGQLRRRIDAPFGRTALRTVRGVGYRLDPDGG
jgi:two-component system OmpR family response regulator